MATEYQEKIYQNIPTLALRGLCVFPGMNFNFDVGRDKSKRALDKAMMSDRRIFLISQKDARQEEPGFSGLSEVGVLARVKQALKLPDGNIRILVEGLTRAQIIGIGHDTPFMTCTIMAIPEPGLEITTKRDEALVREVQQLFLEYGEMVPKMSDDIVSTVMESTDLGYLADFIAQNTQLKYQDKQKVLDQINPRRRLNTLVKIMTRENDILAMEIEIQNRVKESMDKNQRDFYLREQVKAIYEELGEGEDVLAESREYADRIAKADLPDEVREKLQKEASRLAKMQQSSPESAVVRTYLDTCLELPWRTVTEENPDIAKAFAVLERDHFGMDKVKERILEFFAVKQLTGSVKGQILCLVGPPGVGKTSVARSIAEAMGRKYVRISLGGVRDEAEIRGHRKTYIGSMPGRIINAMKQAGSRNCLMLIDEIDKLGSDYKGDPASALLEVFDTEQNVAFRDHFIELPFDLSDVLFVTTANTLDTIPRPLLDRMEVIQVPGYTDEEKVQIARRHLLPKQLEKHGLKKSNLQLTDDTIRAVIRSYTRESGVRTLERLIGKLCRKTAKLMVETGKKSCRIQPGSLAQYLGTPRFKPDDLEDLNIPGVVNGLAWTEVGGEMLEVEAVVVDGTGKLELTGNLGDVMKESVRAAITYIRSRAALLGIAPDFASKKDIHIHFPEGAVPKDGPSAGIAITTVLISALTGRPVPRTIAMTGEISLTGRVLAIGGLREKTMAAYRSGIKTVLIPEQNLPDLDDIDQTVRAELEFRACKHLDEPISFIFGALMQDEKKEGESIPAMPVPKAKKPGRAVRI